jgi:hypothetical protein
LCIGQVKGKQGLWNRAGQNVLAARYDKICFDPFSEMFHLFERVGEKRYHAYFANANGQIIVKEGFINMSLFVNDTAFVETPQGYGMIRRDGSYVVKPQTHSIRNATFPIVSQMAAQQIKRQEMELDNPNLKTMYQWGRLAYPAYQYLLKIEDSVERHQLGNFLMEQVMSNNWLDTNPIGYARHGMVHFYETASFKVPENYNWSHPELSQRYSSQNRTILDVARSATYVSYAQRDTHNYAHVKCYNFKKQNNIWMPIGLNDLFIWDAAAEKQIHKSLLEKISALKYQNIDCGNPAMLMEVVKQQFYVLETGVQFFLPQTRYDDKLPSSVLFTWAELQPFLK